MAYGQGGESEFKAILDNDGLTPSERENTNWNKDLEILLSNGIKAKGIRFRKGCSFNSAGPNGHQNCSR